MTAETANSITVWGPLVRADLPGLCARVCRVLGANAGGILECDVASVATDMVAVEALCRLQLGARRNGCEVRLRNATRELVELVAFLGLDDVIRADWGALGSASPRDLE